MDVQSLARPGVRALKPYQPGKSLTALEREYGIRDAVKLASNENPLGPSARAVAAVQDAAAQLGRYPDGNGFALKTAIAGKLGVAAEQITLGNGSNDVLEIAARVFVTRDHEVVFSQYAFAVYPLVTQAIGAKAVTVPARDWGHDLAGMARAITAATRLVFIANPNNPTGTWLRIGELEQFLVSLPGHVIAVVDEAYFEYVDEPGYPNAVQWLDRFPNLIVTRTFSKIYGLAGLRVGYAVSSREIADLLNRVRQPFNVNHLALSGAAAALEDTAHLKRSRTLNREGLRQLGQAFTGMGLAYIPSVANFIAVNLGRPGINVYKALLCEGVIVRPLDEYDMPKHLRVTVGTPNEIRRFLTVLEKVLGAVP